MARTHGDATKRRMRFLSSKSVGGRYRDIELKKSACRITIPLHKHYVVQQKHPKGSQIRLGSTLHPRDHQHDPALRSDLQVDRLPVTPHHLEEHIVRDAHLAAFEHLFLTFFLLLKEFHLSCDVTTVQVAGDVFAHRGERF